MANVIIGSHYKRFIQFFWDPEPRNDDPESRPIWCLGRKYALGYVEKRREESALNEGVQTNAQGIDTEAVIVSFTSDSERPQDESQEEPHFAAPISSEEDRGWPLEFLDDFESKFWFTYRSHFPPIEKIINSQAQPNLTLAVRLRTQLIDPGGFTSDSGFGCMIRSGQSLLANAQSIVKLGRDWRRGECSEQEKEILSLFADDPKAPFSIHRFVQYGADACGKQPGEWFGPSATARSIKALVDQYAKCELSVYVTGDGSDIYENEVLTTARKVDGSFQPLLILVGIRLGIDRVTPVYWEALKKCLQLPQSIGIAGGRPSSSHYFIGVQGDQLFYLDPHQTRPMLPFHNTPVEYTDEDVNSCHTRRLRRLHIEKIDPSMLIAFLVRSTEDLDMLKLSLGETGGKNVINIVNQNSASQSPDGDLDINGIEPIDEDEDMDIVTIP